METNKAELTGMGLRRAPGARSGCGCCAFIMGGLTAIPFLAIITLFLIH